MGLIEIWLTVAAWRKGWRWRALLPFGGAFALMFLVGVGVASGGARVGDVRPLGLMSDLLVIGVLAAMIKHAPKSSPAQAATPLHLDAAPPVAAVDVESDGARPALP
jgi:hypothetical protein